jgi:hypothetical protein
MLHYNACGHKRVINGGSIVRIDFEIGSDATSFHLFAKRKYFFQLGDDAFLLGEGWEGKDHCP